MQVLRAKSKPHTRLKECTHVPPTPPHIFKPKAIQHLCQIIIRRNLNMPTYKPPKHSRPEITKYRRIFSRLVLINPIM